MDWRQFSLSLGIACIGAGIAMWNTGVNPALHPATAAAVQGVAGFLFAGGIAVVVMVAISTYRQRKRDAAEAALRKALRDEIGLRIDEAGAIMRALRSEELWEEAVATQAEWAAVFREWAAEKLDGADRARLFSDEGILSGEPVGMGGDRLGRWRWLNYRNIRLQELAKEYR